MSLGDIMSMIYLQLEQIGGDPDVVHLNCKSISRWSLLVIWPNTSNETQLFNKQSHPTQHQLLELWDQIHTTGPVFATIYLGTLLSCLNVANGQVSEGMGSEQLARVVSLGLLRALSGMDPTSTMVQDLCEHYLRIIPRNANFEGFSCYHIISAIHILFVGKQEDFSLQWIGYNPCPQEYALLANTLVQVAHQARQNQKKVPCWILRFVLHSLSLGTLPSTSITVSSLSIIAIDLGCDISSTRTATLNERYVNTKRIPISLTQNQCTN